jgi:hypothetical protein
MAGDLIRNILQILIDIENITPKIFSFLVIKEGELIGKIFVRLCGRLLRRILGKINFLKFVVSAPKDLMSEVQENLRQNREMPMIRSKI